MRNVWPNLSPRSIAGDAVIESCTLFLAHAYSLLPEPMQFVFILPRYKDTYYSKTTRLSAAATRAWRRSMRQREDWKLLF